MSDLIDRQMVSYKLTDLVNEFEEILSHIREREENDSVCGLCEYDGAYMGQSGDWCNECPGFDKADCFKLKDKFKKEWLELMNTLPSAQPRKGLWIDIKHTFMTKCSVCDWINNDDSSYNFCPCCGADMRPQFEEPEINPCRGCEDYDGKGGCKTKGGCADRRGDSDE